MLLPGVVSSPATGDLDRGQPQRQHGRLPQTPADSNSTHCGCATCERPRSCRSSRAPTRYSGWSSAATSPAPDALPRRAHGVAAPAYPVLAVAVPVALLLLGDGDELEAVGVGPLPVAVCVGCPVWRWASASRNSGGRGRPAEAVEPGVSTRHQRRRQLPDDVHLVEPTVLTWLLSRPGAGFPPPNALGYAVSRSSKESGVMSMWNSRPSTLASRDKVARDGS
jgi:hypothetical protein